MGTPQLEASRLVELSRFSYNFCCEMIDRFCHVNLVVRCKQNNPNDPSVAGKDCIKVDVGSVKRSLKRDGPTGPLQ